MIKKILIIYIALIVVFSGGFYLFLQRGFEKVDEYTQSSNIYNAEVVYDIENIEETEDFITIDGWIIEKGIDNGYINRNILLKDQSGKILVIKTEMTQVDNIPDEIQDGKNYSKAGVIARVKKNKLDKNSKYTIGFLVKNQAEEELVVFTDKNLEVN